MKRFVPALMGMLSIGGVMAETPAERGFQVYQQVCGACHGLEHVAYAQLTDLGLSREDIRTYAARHQVPDGLDEDGDPKTRPAKMTDRIGSPYPGEAMARMANHGSVPPDFSRRALTQEGGSAWIAHMLQSFAPTPPGIKLPAGSYYNTAMPHGHIGMPPPLKDGQVHYRDGTQATVTQMSQDVAAFLDWAAQPHLVARHRVGFYALAYLAVMTLLAFMLKRRAWRNMGRTSRSS